MAKATGQSRADELDFLVHELRGRIHRGEFVPGQRLIEADLVADTGMSRGRVRDALRVLESEGLVQIDRNRGASVRRITRKEVTDTLELMRAISILMTDKAITRSKEPEARTVLLEALREPACQ